MNNTKRIDRLESIVTALIVKLEKKELVTTEEIKELSIEGEKFIFEGKKLR